MNTPFDLVDLRLMVRIAAADSLTKGAEAARMEHLRTDLLDHPDVNVDLLAEDARQAASP